MHKCPDDNAEVICNISYRRFRPIVIEEYQHVLSCNTPINHQPTEEAHSYALECAIVMAHKLNQYEDER